MDRAKARAERGPVVAGIELAADRVRAVVGHRDGDGFRLTGVAQAPLRPGVMAAGLVLDRAAVGGAVASALAAAEGREKAGPLVAAVDGDDVRTYHVATTFERESVDAPLGAGELARALQEARADAERSAREAAAGDAALRGMATVALRDDAAGVAVDGRALASPLGTQGRYVEVRTDVSLAPLVLASAATGALEAARRRGTAACGVYALGRLLAASGLADGAVLRLTADVTALAVIRGSRVAATRAFGLGRDALLARLERASADASVWARCVAQPLPELEGPLPSHWYFLGVPEELTGLPRALADALAAQRGGEAEIAPVRPAQAAHVFSQEPLRADDLVAVGAAFLASGAAP